MGHSALVYFEKKIPLNIPCIFSVTLHTCHSSLLHGKDPLEDENTSIKSSIQKRLATKRDFLTVYKA